MFGTLRIERVTIVSDQIYDFFRQIMSSVNDSYK